MIKPIFTSLKLAGLAGVALVILFGILMFQRFTGSGILVNRTHTAVVTRIQQLNKLETSVFTIEKIIEARTSGTIFQRFLFGDNILLIAQGSVTAGVDFSKLSEDQIRIRGKSITITLPATEIFASDLDESKTQVYNRMQGLLTKGNKDLESNARAAAEDEIRAAACEAGILTEAADSAKIQMTALLQALGFTTIEVKVDAGQC